MELTMQSKNGKPENLPSNDAFMTTGSMGDCVSLIVVFGYDLNTHSYKNVRGWHGLGGASAIEMNAMFKDVPNSPMTKVLILPGSLQQSKTAKKSSMEYVLQGIVSNAKTSVTVKYVEFNWKNFRVDRHAQVTRALTGL
jgi:hypothetical protein